ncbi:hypothetical protein P167DRAFT_610083 [Morchella conica CCBAS932]|uniref:Uncharacterized protein n=1 Tax=Morchella conica CCBAS932 TaxID=1392247 RepID=A0A3N4KAE0_9PEZI|nr:hypothetical protein P167DRAFT_610083 [Morchella conica CCBAS932]
MEWEWETTAQLPAERAPMPMPIAKPTVVVAPTVMSMAHVLAPVSMPAPSISVPVVSKTRSPPAQPAPVMSVALPPMRVRRAGEPVMPQQSLPAPTPARAPAPVPIPAPTPAPAPATLMPPPVIPAPVTPMGPPPRPAPVAHMAPPPMPTSPNTISPPTVPAAGVRSVPGKKIALWLEPLPDHVQVGRTFTPMAPMMAMPAPHPQPRAKPKPKPQPAKPPTPPPVDAVDADYDSFEEEYEAGVAEELGKPVPEKKRTPPAPAPGGAAFKFDVTALSFAPPPATGAAQGMLKLVSKKGTVLRGKTVGPEAEKLRARRRLERLDRDGMLLL